MTGWLGSSEMTGWLGSSEMTGWLDSSEMTGWLDSSVIVFARKTKGPGFEFVYLLHFDNMRSIYKQN